MPEEGATATTGTEVLSLLATGDGELLDVATGVGDGDAELLARTGAIGGVVDAIGVGVVLTATGPLAGFVDDEAAELSEPLDPSVPEEPLSGFAALDEAGVDPGDSAGRPDRSVDSAAPLSVFVGVSTGESSASVEAPDAPDFACVSVIDQSCSSGSLG